MLGIVGTEKETVFAAGVRRTPKAAGTEARTTIEIARTTKAAPRIGRGTAGGENATAARIAIWTGRTTAVRTLMMRTTKTTSEGVGVGAGAKVGTCRATARKILVTIVSLTVGMTAAVAEAESASMTPQIAGEAAAILRSLPRSLVALEGLRKRLRLKTRDRSPPENELVVPTTPASDRSLVPGAIRRTYHGGKSQVREKGQELKAPAAARRDLSVPKGAASLSPLRPERTALHRLHQ